MIPCTVLSVEGKQTAIHEQRRDDTGDGRIFDVVIAFSNFQGLIEKINQLTGTGGYQRGRVQGLRCSWINSELDLYKGTEGGNQTVSLLRPTHVSDKDFDLSLVQDRHGRVDVGNKDLDACINDFPVEETRGVEEDGRDGAGLER